MKQFSVISSSSSLDDLVISSAKNSESIQKLVNISKNSTEAAFTNDLQKEMKKLNNVNDVLENKIDLRVIDEKVTKMTAEELESSQDELYVSLINIWKNNSNLP